MVLYRMLCPVLCRDSLPISAPCNSTTWKASAHCQNHTTRLALSRLTTPNRLQRHGCIPDDAPSCSCTCIPAGTANQPHPYATVPAATASRATLSACEPGGATSFGLGSLRLLPPVALGHSRPTLSPNCLSVEYSQASSLASSPRCSVFCPARFESQASRGVLHPSPANSLEPPESQAAAPSCCPGPRGTVATAEPSAPSLVASMVWPVPAILLSF